MKPSTLRGSFPSELTLISESPEETLALGEKIGALLHKGDIVALFAPLGAGKTVLTKGIARGLGVFDTVTSPTWSIISEYEGTALVLYHIDAYRLGSSAEFIETGGEELLFSGGVSVIEWSERIIDLLPHTIIKIDIKILEGDKREIHYENCS